MDPVVILGAETISVGPGQEARLAVRVRNQGRRVESYRIDVIGVPASFAEVDPRTVSVLPGREAEVGVVFRPPAGAATPTGTLPFAVRATSEVEASASAVAEGRLDVAGVGGLQAWAPETTRSGRWSARYNVEFANNGNAAVRLAVTAHDPAGALRLTLSDDVVDLPPGGRATAQVTAKTRQPFLRGTPVNRIVQVTCQNFPFGAERPVPGGAPPVDDPDHRTFQLTFQQKPILPKVAIVALVLLVAVIAAVVVLQLRNSDEYTLGLARPESPTELVAEPLGPTGVSLSWLAVPNASSYTLSMNGAATDDDIKPPPIDRRVSYAVEDLKPGTEYCFTVVAVAPVEAGNSEPSSEACATTGVPTRLPAPTDVTVNRDEGDRYRVEWRFPEDVEGVAFTVLLDNAPAGDGITDSPTTIQIPAEPEEREVRIAVQAVRDGERSAPSEAQVITIAALPPPTTSATTPSTDGPATTVSTGTTPTTAIGGDTTTTDGGATTTAAGTTTTSSTSSPPTVPVPASTELQDLPPTYVAMLGQWTRPSEGGVPLEDRKERLASDYQVSEDDLDVFSNRDTVAAGTDGEPDDTIAGASPDRQFIYASVAAPENAQAICDRQPGGDCRVMVLTGAAQSSIGSPVLVLDTFDADTPISQVDARTSEFRAAVDDHPVNVLDGGVFAEFDASQVVIYARGFADASETSAVCAELGLATCTSVVLAER